jgi:hypothetical protein
MKRVATTDVRQRPVGVAQADCHCDVIVNGVFIWRMHLFLGKGACQSVRPRKGRGMYRYWSDKQRIRREHHFRLRYVHRWLREPVDCACELQAGRFRKKKALDCGKARCLLCSYDKIFGIRSYQDKVRDLRYRDSVRDYFETKATHHVHRENARPIRHGLT